MFSIISLVLVALVAPLLVPAAFIIALRLTLEKLQPMAAERRDLGVVNFSSCIIWNIASNTFAPAVSVMTVLLVNHLGGGWIVLPDHGLGLALGFIVYALSMDLGEYLFHRAEHAIQALWSMHSLHHSDAHFDASTGILHYWGAPLAHSLTTAVPLALIFKVPPADLTLWMLMSYHVYLMHANVKWDFGRWWWLLSSPVYHRTHHSAQPEHFNSNFASLFPVWDVVFGTAIRVSLHALPQVGLGPGREPRSLTDIVLWPLRFRAAEKAGAKSAHRAEIPVLIAEHGQGPASPWLPGERN
jgi:sterol desaturase/sphingolipid hydroxylase (fatty acid hydroxylase superfamily)